MIARSSGKFSMTRSNAEPAFANSDSGLVFGWSAAPHSAHAHGARLVSLLLARIPQLLLKLLHPYAPFITEELWSEALGHKVSILDAGYPTADESLLYEAEFECPVSINGKLRTRIMLRRGMSEDAVKSLVLLDATVQRWLSGGRVDKFIFVPDRIVNIVCSSGAE